jgi:hypothetical protein
MVMGPVALGQQPLRLTISREPVELVEEFKYIGIHSMSMARNTFAEHYHIKALKARNIINATFAMEAIVGCLPPREGAWHMWTHFSHFGARWHWMLMRVH